MTALSTAGFAAGVRYTMYRAQGLSSEAFDYHVAMTEEGRNHPVGYRGRGDLASHRGRGRRVLLLRRLHRHPGGAGAGEGRVRWMAMAKPKKKRRWLRRLITWLVLLTVAAGAFALFVLPTWQPAEATTTYVKYTASRGTISNALSFSGSVSVVNNETLTAGAAATVRTVYVAEGDQVESGERLLRLSTGETLEASFDGTVNELSVEEGDEVAAGASLIQIVDFAHMKVTMRVDEYQISQVSEGQACRITVTALGETFDSEITHINRISASQGSTAYYTVTCEMDVTEDVLPGMAVTVTIPQEEAVDVVVLSKDALSFDVDNSAYVLQQTAEGVMEKVPVEIGVDNDNYVEITAGLSEGDEVYAEETTSASASTGLSSLMSLFGGGSMPGGSAPSGMQNSRQNRDFGGDFGGGSMGGSMGGGFGGMR